MSFYALVQALEGINLNKNIEITKAHYLCCFYFFKDKKLNYQPYLCKDCLKLIQKIKDKMLYYEKMSVSEGIDTNKMVMMFQNYVIFATSISLKTKTLIMNLFLLWISWCVTKSYKSK